MAKLIAACVALAGISLLLLMPVVWIVPEWIGSGNPLDGGRQARSQPIWSLSLAEHPWLRALVRVDHHAGLGVELLALSGMAWALVRRRRAVVVLGAGALAEVALFVAMTESGFSGNPRYVLPAIATASVLAGVGTAGLADAGGALAGRLGSPLPRLAGAAAGLTLAAVVAVPFLEQRGQQLRGEARQVERRMDTHRDLAQAVDQAGGPGAIAAIGTATANRTLHSRLAWELTVPIDQVERVTDHRVVFRSLLERLNGSVYMRGRARSRRTLARVGGIWVYRRDGITFPLARRSLGPIGSPFTASLQGINTSAKEGRNSGARVVTR